MNNYALTGASFPIKISGKEFAAYTLRDKDYDELSAYIQSKVIEMAIASIPTSLPADVRTEWRLAAVRAAASAGWGTTEGGRIMNTADGYFRLCWQMIRKRGETGDITYRDFEKFASHSDHATDNIYEIDRVFGILHNSPKDEDEEATEEDESQEDSSVKKKSK